MLFGLCNDIRYAARTLARNPGFALAAIVTIALGVGVNTGIFTVLNGVLFRDLPAPNAHELVTIQQQTDGVPDRQGGPLVSTADYRSYAERTKTLSGLVGYSDPTRTTLGGDSPELVIGTIVTCNYFEVLRQPPALGRGLAAQDCATGADPVVVLTNDLWTARFDADPGIVGRTVELNRRLFTVVGVAREGTYSGFGLYRTAYFAPISTEPLLLPNENSYGNDKRAWLFLLGRRVASVEQVRAELRVIAAEIDRREPGRSTTLSVERATLLAPIGFVRRIALAVGAVIMGAFALVLLIACANIANLLLARATVRSHEIALRLSLGANRARLVRQLLVESVLISIAGGALGSALALWSFQVLIGLALPLLTPVGVPPLVLDASPDVRVLLFTLLLTAGTGVLFGLAPALHVSKPNLHTAIKGASLVAGSRRTGRLQGMLVGAQVAMCLVLTIAAGLLLRGLGATQTIDPGFDYGNVAIASYDLPSAGYDSARAAVLQRRLLDEVGALPGVEAAAQAELEPLRADESESAAIRLPSEERSGFRLSGLNIVTPGYFDLLGMPIVQGRTFDDAELTDTSTAAIVTEATARNLWPGQDPIGRTLTMTVGPGMDVALHVVGVAKDAQVTGIGQIDPYYLYLPASPRAATLLRLLVRSRTDFAATAAAVRAAVHRLDPGVPVVVNPLQANLDYWRNFSGTLTALAATLGVLALVLASVGIYGVVAYFVGRRRREIGIRMALGAEPRDVLGHVLKRTMRPVVIGAAIGLAAAIGVSNALSSVLFGVSPLDPIGVGATALFVLGVALAAGILPGRRAARTQPMAVLREE